MKDLDLLSLKLGHLANNVKRPELMNRIEYLKHNMDKMAYEQDYSRLEHVPYVNLPEDIDEGNIDLEMYEKWLKE